jgi:hypothetical protein
MNGSKRNPESAATFIDSNIWGRWKDSSTSQSGKVLQMAIAEELHGRLNYDQLGTRKEINDLRQHADYEFPGGYEALKAYLRAKWETTQCSASVTARRWAR